MEFQSATLLYLLNLKEELKHQNHLVCIISNLSVKHFMSSHLCAKYFHHGLLLKLIGSSKIFRIFHFQGNKQFYHLWQREPICPLSTFQGSHY